MKLQILIKVITITYLTISVTSSTEILEDTTSYEATLNKILTVLLDQDIGASEHDNDVYFRNAIIEFEE